MSAQWFALVAFCIPLTLMSPPLLESLVGVKAVVVVDLLVGVCILLELLLKFCLVDFEGVVLVLLLDPFFFPLLSSSRN